MLHEHLQSCILWLVVNNLLLFCMMHQIYQFYFENIVFMYYQALAAFSFLLDQNFSTLWLDLCLCDAATVWCWYCIYCIYIVKGTRLISKKCMKNNLKGIVSATCFKIGGFLPNIYSFREHEIIIMMLLWFLLHASVLICFG